ncbi:hypothetical protein PORY_001834 [Pneumocystis oryctolagi]|uniref:Uncharacterized protein n=1 Tax=Pneumocystis oryctolagi TaxID=42067 RepID=A0ACB7CB55_9ASCO|nr:hypothetical protein PORY_001834 [Pneumocystis oryctolagi]
MPKIHVDTQRESSAAAAEQQFGHQGSFFIPLLLALFTLLKLPPEISFEASRRTAVCAFSSALISCVVSSTGAASKTASEAAADAAADAASVAAAKVAVFCVDDEESARRRRRRRTQRRSPARRQWPALLGGLCLFYILYTLCVCSTVCKHCAKEKTRFFPLTRTYLAQLGTRGRRITLTRWKGRLGIDLREYYEDANHEMRPGKKGITLMPEQLCVLADVLPCVQAQVEAMQAERAERAGKPLGKACAAPSESNT